MHWHLIETDSRSDAFLKIVPALLGKECMLEHNPSTPQSGLKLLLAWRTFPTLTTTPYPMARSSSQEFDLGMLF